MGYATMCFRKVALTNQINDLEYRILTLTMRQQALSQVGGAIGDGNLTGKEYDEMDPLARMWTNNLYQTAINGGGVEFNGVDSQGMSTIGFTGEARDMMQYTINQKEKEIEAEMARLETQLKAKQSELESVLKQEDADIKRTTPKYGQG